jgi:hypothetical protein
MNNGKLNNGKSFFKGIWAYEDKALTEEGFSA